MWSQAVLYLCQQEPPWPIRTFSGSKPINPGWGRGMVKSGFLTLVGKAASRISSWQQSFSGGNTGIFIWFAGIFFLLKAEVFISKSLTDNWMRLTNLEGLIGLTQIALCSNRHCTTKSSYCCMQYAATFRGEDQV